MHNPNPISMQCASASVSGERFYAALSEIGQLLVRSLEPAMLYEAVIEVLERQVGARLVMVGQLDRETASLRRIAPADVPAGMEDIYPDRVPFCMAGPAFWQGAPQIEAPIRHTPGLELMRPAYVRHAVSASVAVPVLKFGEVCAALLIRADEASYFSTQMINLLQQAAVSIGLGLEADEHRTRLRHALREEGRQGRALRLLSEMTKLVTHSADERSLLLGTCQVVHEVGGYCRTWIGLLDDDGHNLHLCTHDVPAQAPGPLLPLADLGDDHAAVLAIATGQPQRRARAPADSINWPFAATDNTGVQAVLALPLRVADEIVGVLVIGAPHGDAFAQSDTGIFLEMAVELGLGIQMQRSRAAQIVAEQKLRFNLLRFRTILSNQYAGILVVDDHGIVTFVNEAFCTQFNFTQTPAELENRSSETIYTQIRTVYRQPDSEIARIRQIVARNKPVRSDEIVTNDGRVFLRDYMPIVIDGVVHGRMWQQRDITEQKTHEASVERLAFYDVVTGLPNRRLLFELLERARDTARAQPGLLAVGVLDLDRFKSVNDSIGHGGGDHVLAEASARILGLLREADVLGRFGGDEFALVIPGLDSKEQLDVISRCIVQALRAPFNLMGEQVFLSASIGWTLFPLDDCDAEGLVRHADLAMYAAKEEGKDRGKFYEPAMAQEQLRLQAMRERIAHALQQSNLQLLFQPIVYIDGLPGLNGVAGMEALLRLNDEGQELIGPASFMHVLDDPQLARPIGRYVLEEALRCCQAWMEEGISIPVSINISTRHLLHPSFFTDIDAVLENYPNVMDVGFGIEVTETGPTMDHARAKIVIEECRHRGIRVGLDDFGTGTASLSHIQQLDIEHIKLDQSFVRDILNDERNMAIAAGVITTARMLAKTVIAEGVETAEQGDLLASLGCHQLQGFSISRPMLPGDVPAWVAGWAPPKSWGVLTDERQSLLARHPDGR